LSESTKKKKSPLFVIFVILAITGATAFWYYTLYAPVNFEEFNDEVTYRIPQDQSSVNQFNLELNADVGSFNIDLLPDSSSDAISIEWSCHYYMNSEHLSELPINIEMNNFTLNNSLYFELSILHSNSDLIKMLNLDVFIHLSPNFELYNLTGIVNVGSVFMGLQDVTVGNLNFYSGTGSYQVSLTNTVITAGFFVESDVGSIELDLDNIDYVNNPTISLQSSVGSIEIDLYQNYPVQSNVSFICFTDTGSIEIDMQSSHNISLFDVYGDTSTGSIDIELDEGVRLSDNHYCSTTYFPSNLPTFWISATTSVGSVDVDIEYF